MDRIALGAPREPPTVRGLTAAHPTRLPIVASFTGDVAGAYEAATDRVIAALVVDRS